MRGNYQKRTPEEWEELIRQCKSSGLSDYEWCRQNGISSSTFYRHLDKFHDATELADIKAKKPVIHQEVVPLIIRDEDSDFPFESARDLTAELPSVKVRIGNTSIEISNNADSRIILDVLRAAASLC